MERIADSKCTISELKKKFDLSDGAINSLEKSGYIKKNGDAYDLTIYGWANFLQEPGQNVRIFKTLSRYTVDDFKPPYSNLTRVQRAHEVLGAYLLFPKIFI